MRKPLSTEGDENRLFWFPFKAEEWLADRDIRFMTPCQRGLYIQLMVESWQDAGVLLNDRDILWKVAGAESKESFDRESGPVLAKFEQAEMDGKPILLHRRLANLYVKQDKNYRQRCDAGRSSADKRRQGREQGEAAETRDENEASQTTVN